MSHSLYGSVHPTAITILEYIKSKPKSWNFSTSRIGEQLKDPFSGKGLSQPTVTKYLKQLEQLGYLHRQRTHHNRVEYITFNSLIEKTAYLREHKILVKIRKNGGTSFGSKNGTKKSFEISNSNVLLINNQQVEKTKEVKKENQETPTPQTKKRRKLDAQYLYEKLSNPFTFDKFFKEYGFDLTYLAGFCEKVIASGVKTLSHAINRAIYWAKTEVLPTNLPQIYEKVKKQLSKAYSKKMKKNGQPKKDKDKDKHDLNMFQRTGESIEDFEARCDQREALGDVRIVKEYRNEASNNLAKSKEQLLSVKNLLQRYTNKDKNQPPYSLPLATESQNSESTSSRFAKNSKRFCKIWQS